CHRRECAVVAPNALRDRTFDLSERPAGSKSPSMAERQAKGACLLPECSPCALHGSCNLLDWRLASRVCPQLFDILLRPGSAFRAPRSFGCHQIPPIDDVLDIFRSLNELVDSNLCGILLIHRLSTCKSSRAFLRPRRERPRGRRAAERG